MRSLLTPFARLRRHPDRRMRAAWWGGIALLAGAVVAPGSAGVLVVSVWWAVNVGLLVTGGVWGLLKPRALRPAIKPAAVGSALLAVASVLLLGSTLVVSVSEQMPDAVTPATRTLFLLILFALGGVLWGGFLLYALVSASLGLFAGRRIKDPQAPGLGVFSGWLVLLLLVLLQGIGQALGVADPLMTVAAAGYPILVVGLSRCFLRPGLAPIELAGRTAGVLARVLIRRWGPPGKERRLDFRGAALGLLTGTIGLVLALSPILLPLQSRVLVTFMQIRSGLRVLPSIRGERSSVKHVPVPRVALLEMDSAARRAIDRRSESVVQAEIVRKLAGYNARVVLPLPVLDLGDPRELTSFTEAAGLGFPPPTEAEVVRSCRDIDILADACRAAGSVLLAVPSPHIASMSEPGALALERLQGAVAAVGRADLPSFGAAELPVINLSREEFPGPFARHPLARSVLPLPLLLQDFKGMPGRLGSPPKALPRIAGDRVLVDVRATQPSVSFPRISYGSVLREERLFVPRSEGDGKSGHWESPREFFQGRVVFLDGLAPRLRDTVAGRMTQSEVMAHAMVTLQSGITARRAPGWIHGFLILMGAVVAGSVCTGRSPLQSSRNAGALCLAALAGCGLLFLLSAGLPQSLWGGEERSPLWLDPVVPCLTIMVTNLLAANLTLAVERARREQNRSLLQRFVEPRIVEELLREMEHPGSELGLGGNRQQVCVLFADVRGFTRFAESESPEVVIEVTNRYLTALTGPLRRHGGLLDKYLGDGLMGLFRVVDPAADLPRAVRAALAMRDAVSTVSAEQAAQEKPVLDVGFGLHFGEAVVGLVGNPDQFSYTALGHTVVVAQRLQTLAAGGEVILSETVYPHVAGEIAAEPGEPVAVKGLSRPVRFYRITGQAEGCKAEIPVGDRKAGPPDCPIPNT